MQRRGALLVFLSGTLSMLAVIAQAQPQAPPTPPPEREGSAEFAYVGTSGNSRTQSIGAGGQVIYRPAPWEIQLKVSYVRNEAEAQLKAQSLTFNARGQRQLRPRLAAYGQYGYLRDRFAGVLDRNAVEAGLAYSLIDSAPHKLTADAGLAYANERRLVGNNLSTAAVGAGGAYVLKISSTSDFSEDGHFTFSLSEGADWRFTNAAAVTAKMTTVFSLKLSNTIRYVNLPVLGFDRTDTVTAIALVAKF